MSTRTDEHDSSTAGIPLDLLLVDATRSAWSRWTPTASSATFAVGLARHPRTVAGRARALLADLAGVVAGTSSSAPEPRDRRFADPAWRDNPVLRRILQAYLCTARTAESLVDDAGLGPADGARVRTAITNLCDALAPSNGPLTNPAALKAAIDSGGANYLRGLRRLGRDLATPPRIPSMVEADAFALGTTVAATAGQVVLRTPVLELIHYAPRTERVRHTPLVIVPPTINKYYVVDIAPQRSLTEYLVGQGHQVFTISWRNPDARHAAWDRHTYGEAILAAFAAARAITGAAQNSVLSLCSGGILTSMVLSHLAHHGTLHTVAAAAQSVAVLDQHQAGLPAALLTPAAAEAAVRSSAARGYLDGRSLAELFAWLRPNDLVWNYWVESYLLGRSPKPVDLLFWNADTTRMTAGLHRDFIDIARRNALATPGAATMLDSPVDLGAIDVDTYVTAGAADHLCPWQSCYATTQLIGGKCQFVLSTSGHIASIVNPPGNPRAHFRISDNNPSEADDWLAGAETVQGSWWPHFSDWLHARGGHEITAPDHLGDPEHPPLGMAPGTYVRTR